MAHIPHISWGYGAYPHGSDAKEKLGTDFAVTICVQHTVAAVAETAAAEKREERGGKEGRSIEKKQPFHDANGVMTPTVRHLLGEEGRGGGAVQGEGDAEVGVVGIVHGLGGAAGREIGPVARFSTCLFTTTCFIGSSHSRRSAGRKRHHNMLQSSGWPGCGTEDRAGTRTARRGWQDHGPLRARGRGKNSAPQ